MSAVREAGISRYSPADRENGLRDWPTIINDTANRVSAWREAAGFWAHSSADYAMRAAEKELQLAVEAWNGRGLSVRIENVNAVCGARVNGALAQVKEKPLAWSDPFIETKDEIVDAAKKAAAPLGVGLGFGLVVAGLLYFAVVTAPGRALWKS